VELTSNMNSHNIKKSCFDIILDFERSHSRPEHLQYGQVNEVILEAH
jgi:hypothetical protein